MKSEAKVEKIMFRDAVKFPSTTYATFGLYRYPAKFIPQVIAYTLEKYAKNKMKTFDPFAGYGTMGVVSRIYGYDYEMWDLNPLIETLHQIAIMKPLDVKTDDIISGISASRDDFMPDWSRMQNWFPQEFLPFLHKVWGYYHNLSDKQLKLLLTIPLLKTTRYFSYDDMQRQKLSKSKKSEKRVEKILSSDWQNKFYNMLKNDIERVSNGINEYQTLSPKPTKTIVRGGIDSMKEKLKEKKDILITSPPYLQSQEYMRQAKIDLFWMGFKEEKVKQLSKMEIPYCDVEPCKIYSKTFKELERQMKEEHIRMMFDKYFWGTLGAFTRLQEKVSSYLCLFVGHTSTRGKTIPIDKIFVEHLTNFGWRHETTLMDTIVSRRLFSYKTNPATGINDKRTPVENLVVLKKN